MKPYILMRNFFFIFWWSVTLRFKSLAKHTWQLIINLVFVFQLLSSLKCILQAQTNEQWGEPSTMHLYNAVLSFISHSNPKVKTNPHWITAGKILLQQMSSKKSQLIYTINILFKKPNLLIPLMRFLPPPPLLTTWRNLLSPR